MQRFWLMDWIFGQISWSRLLDEVWFRIPTEATCFKPFSGSYQLRALHCRATLIWASFGGYQYTTIFDKWILYDVLNIMHKLHTYLKTGALKLLKLASIYSPPPLMPSEKNICPAASYQSWNKRATPKWVTKSHKRSRSSPTWLLESPCGVVQWYNIIMTFGRKR